MEYRRKHTRNDEPSHDSPTYSRLFIVGDKRATEDMYREAFSKFGTIEDLRIPRDRNSGEPKGIVFIKFSKTSEAARALENLHQTTLQNTNRPMKVMVAANRSDIQTDDDDDFKYKRLFITVPHVMDENTIKNTFMSFGDVEQVRIQLDRNTGESKGFAYVRYKKFSEAAKAIEECEPKFRAIFALPRGHNRRPETSYESNINHLAESTSNMKNSLLSAMNTRPDGYSSIDFMCSPFLTHMHVERIFDIVPGMVNCKYMVDLRNFGKGTVTYSNPVSAAYAVDKLHRFEYPPGAKIFVKPNNSMFHPHEQNFTNIPNVVKNLKNAITSTANSSSPDLAQLAEAIAEASKLIKKATTGVTDEAIPDGNDLNYCSVKLPPQKPLADIDSSVAKRCFLVCKPQPPPLTVLRDVFCRFGELINVYTLPGKTVGYARYASVESADNAIKTLHGAEICGVRMKVLEADDEAPPKKSRYED